MTTVLGAGAAGLSPMVAGPWLARLPLELLDRLAGLRPRPATRFYSRRYRSGFVAQRSAEDLTAFHLLDQTVRETAVERGVRFSG